MAIKTQPGPSGSGKDSAPSVEGKERFLMGSSAPTSLTNEVLGIPAKRCGVEHATKQLRI